MRFRSLRYRIAATIFILEAIMMSGVLWLTLSSSYEATSAQIEETDQVILKNLSELGRIALLTDEYSDLQPFIQNATEDPHVMRVLLTNNKGIIYASSQHEDLGKVFREPGDERDRYWRSVNIKNPAGELGTLWVYFSNIEHRAAYSDALSFGVIVALIGMAIIAIAGLLIGGLLTRHLNALGEAAKQYTQGNFDVRAPIEGDEEIRNLGRTLNRMADEIRHNIDALKDSEESFRSIFNLANDAIFLIDPVDDRIVNANPKACHMLEYDYRELLKIPVSAVYLDESSMMNHFIQEVMDQGAAITDDLVCLTSSGRRILVSISASKIHLDGKQYVLAQVRDITERKAFEKELAASERLFREMVDALPISICQTDFNGNATFVNSLWLQQTGMTFEESLGHGWYSALHPDDREATLGLLKKNAFRREPWELEYRFQRDDGEVLSLIGKVVAICDEDERIAGYLGANIDITEYKKTEFALRRSQKMEAIGQLSGGIAHDFNNLLSAILGSIELLELRAELDANAQKRIDTIKHSALRAAELTSQLLGFSRKEVRRSMATDINQVINSVHTLITQSVTPQVEVVQKLGVALWQTDIDAGDFEDALINIVLNARDAMQGRGRLTIETRNSTLDQSYCNINPDVAPGDYVELAISDDGCGITKQQMEHIFEPFYTSKAQGEGTGLGLSMVFGFVKRSNGSVKVYSEPGIGTTIRIYLPRAGHVERRSAVTESKLAELPRGNETVLVVDDELQLLELVETVLLEQGFKVFTAEDATQAMAVLQREQGIEIMVSDVVMPGEMNGYELAEKACSLYPDLKVLLTSGYTEKAVARNGQAKFNANLLSKPYTLHELMSRLKSMLSETR